MKTKIKLLNACNLIIAGLCALLGFASCTTFGADEYGTPSAKFIVNGKVLSKETQQPLKNVRVIMQETINYLPFNPDTTFTDDKGIYQLIRESFPQEQTFLIQFQAVDNNYTPLDTLVTFSNPEFTGGSGNWYAGETSKKVDVKLTPQDDSN